MLHYKIHRKAESAEWVVFIHGAGGSSSVWFKQLRSFRQKYSVLMIDLRGQGRSGDVEETKDERYDFDAVTEDVISVLDYENIVNAHIIALSLGAVISRVLLNKREDLVKSLILV
ncbi:MAG: alpha/beta fold hydrolase, partial [Lentisphaeria bacterium]